MQSRGTMDLVGVAGSAICLVHCLAGPLLLLLAPIVPAIVQSDQQFHQSMLFLVVPVSTVAFLIGCRRHRDAITLVLGATGLVTLSLAATSLHGSLGGSGEKLFTVFASMLLGIAHLRNFKLCRAVDCDHSTADAA